MSLQQSKYIQVLRSFAGAQSGSAMIKPALVFAAFGLALAVLLTPQVERAADSYAENRALGIDRILTGSTEKIREYTVRRSVLDEEYK